MRRIFLKQWKEKNHTPPPLPEGVTDELLNLAGVYRDWYIIHNKTVQGQPLSPQEQRWFSLIPTVAGRPIFLSQMTTEEAAAFDRACTYFQQYGEK